MELVLHTVVCAQEPLTVDGLAGLLNIDLAEVTAALEPLCTLHASFPDFMLDSSRSGQLACNAEAHNTKLAELCFGRVKRNKSRFNICNLESSFVFDGDVPDINARVKQAVPLDLAYACRYWAIHLQLSGKSDAGARELYEFLSQRLLLWMEVLNLTREIDEGIGIMETAVSWVQVTDCSKTIKMLAQDARRFVALFATSPVAKSTPHIYVSMLASWPNEHPVAQCYAQQMTDLVRIQGIQTTQRQLAMLSMIAVGSQVRCISFSPNGRFFAVGTDHNEILVWDALTCRTTIGPLKRHTSTVRTIAISPDSKHICSGSHDSTLCIWDSQNGHLIAGPLESHTGWVRSVDYSADGLWIASGSSDNTVRIWSSQHGYAKGNVYMGREDCIYSVTFSPDGSVLAIGSDSLIQLWDPHHGRLIGDPLKGHTDYISAIKFTPDGRHLISGSRDSTLRVWDVDRRETIFGPFQEQPFGINDIAVSSDAVSSLAFSPDGSLIASGSHDKTLRLWNAPSGIPMDVPPITHSGAISCIAFSPNGAHGISGTLDSTVHVWEVESGQSIAVFCGHTDQVCSVSFSPGGNLVASGSADQTIRLWNTPAPANFTSTDTFECHPDGSVHEVTHIPDWKMDEDGWVKERQDRLLLWVPPDLRSALLWPQNRLLISRQGCIELDFSDARIGRVWTTCYHPA
ncbi:unnamed protein product [Rhizoctonia solani]|uniref:Vegetative incompatibility protein HET-E-1 n=1 Tax=Rhizoctonia solani TaxID=456999 RepID=A0A8H3CRC6_9AGAM|nr:unnamed protein product [Rhizoctonia solani]